MNVDLEKYKHIIESLHEGIIIHDKDFNILYINKFMSDILGYSIKELNSLNILDILDETNQNIIKINSIDIEENKSYDLKIITKNKTFKYIRLTSSLYIDNDVEYKLCICEDITSIHREETVKSCIYKISEAIHDVDDLQSLYKEIHYILSEVTNTNNFYIALVDWENEILTFPYFVDEFDKPPKPRKLENGLTEYVLRSEESILLNHELYLKLVKNKSIDVRGSDSKNWLGVPLKLTNGKTIGMIGIQSYKKDIFFTEEDLKILLFVSDQIAMAIKRKIDDIKIHKQAHYDQLTGLTNKALFHDRLEHAIDNAKRHDEVLAVLFIDLDNFKYVNDSMGHSAGDKLIKLISKRLEQCVRKGDTVSRWGGDEFTVLLPSIKRITGIYKLCNRILNESFTDVVIEGQELRITASIGIALYPQDGEDADKLISNADAAMYNSKNMGKNQYNLFKPKMNNDILERISFENGLFRAIEKEEFDLVYQPQILLEKNKLIGFEALIRWYNPEKGVLAPYKFIPIAEETNLILPLGEWIINKVCQENKKWHDKGYNNLTCAVNISAKQFYQDNIIEIIEDALKKSKLNPSFLELELTESVIMDDVDRAVKIFTKLKDMGIKLSIDDFGTGYSSLSYLKKFPIDTLKIDQSFISNLTKDSINDITIANLVIDLGHKLGMQVIAEGVETQQQINFLTKYACDKIQGYIVSKPLKKEDFEKLLETNYNS
tara:strand:- start:2539 stop:4692 length:2154 start_codon:yes stop_codon:yes gene_type:complete